MNVVTVTPIESADFSLNGRVAVVTGGSRGIGAGIVELLVERGAAVGFTFHQQEAPARALESSIRENGGRGLTAHCDVADDAAVTISKHPATIVVPFVTRKGRVSPFTHFTP